MIPVKVVDVIVRLIINQVQMKKSAFLSKKKTENACGFKK
jgi:hypothetical protein